MFRSTFRRELPGQRNDGHVADRKPRCRTLPQPPEMSRTAGHRSVPASGLAIRVVDPVNWVRGPRDVVELPCVRLRCHAARLLRSVRTVTGCFSGPASELVRRLRVSVWPADRRFHDRLARLSVPPRARRMDRIRFVIVGGCAGVVVGPLPRTTLADRPGHERRVLCVRSRRSLPSLCPSDLP